MQAGSRADYGLLSAAAINGNLVMTFNDPARRRGDCCSTGTIELRYRWRDGACRPIGKTVSN